MAAAHTTWERVLHQVLQLPLCQEPLRLVLLRDGCLHVNGMTALLLLFLILLLLLQLLPVLLLPLLLLLVPLLLACLTLTATSAHSTSLSPHGLTHHLSARCKPCRSA